MSIFNSLLSAAPSDPLPDRIEVHPAEILLDGHRSRAQLVVTGHYADGQVRDLTHSASYSVAESDVAVIDGTVALPRRDGRAMLAVAFGPRVAHVSVQVVNFDRPDPVRFQAEALAVLTKQGCNAGSCHGSPEGKNGFRLSLFAYAPHIDEESLIRDGLGRRTNVLDPVESLMLRKPTLKLPHVGGKRLREGQWPYQLLYDWIHEGARADGPDAPQCIGITVYPAAGRVLSEDSLTQQISVWAQFSDGSQRDVTHLASYDTSHPAIATADENGLITGHARGEAAITVRYLESLESLHVTVVKGVGEFAWPDPPPAENNYIDRLVHAKLRQLGYAPSGTCSDEVFIRRVHLDVLGLPPTPGEARVFLADTSADKRDRLIEALLERPEFARFWSQKTADLMRLNEQVMTPERAERFAAWLRGTIATNMPFDQFAREILTATGDGSDHPPANYFAAIPTMEERTEVTAQIFMGSRIQCAKCHNHPFENWTQDAYYRLGAVFARVATKDGVVKVAESGEAKHPATGQVMTPWGASPDSAEHEGDRREAFADWLTRPGNPYFARVEVNRIWAHLLGRGIVEPVDDFRSSNPPVNVELLDALAADFERSGYDRKHILRAILRSRTYQRSAEPTLFNENENDRFSRTHVRLLTAEQLHDAIGRVTGVLLPSESAIEQRAADAQSELKALLDRMARQRPAWEETQRAKVAQMPRVLGAWHVLGPVPESDEQIDVVRLQSEALTSGTSQPQWEDGKPLNVRGGKGFHYLYRRVIADGPQRIVLMLGSSDGVKLWVNGALLHEHTGKRELKVDEDRIEAELAAGVNEIFVQLAAGATSLSFRLLGAEEPYEPVEPEDRLAVFRRVLYGEKPPAEDPAAIPPHILVIAALPNDQRSPRERQMLDERYEATEPKIAALRDEIRRLSGRLDFATQRPYPQPSELLTAFGQPERKTACTCERLDKPTLIQALQMLNGEEVDAMVRRGPDRYVHLSDETLIEELYLAALSRRPTPSEQAAAAAHLAAAADRRPAIEDLIWAVVNTREFMFQH